MVGEGFGSSKRLLSNIVYEFQRQLPREQAQEAGYGLAALIDGLWPAPLIWLSSKLPATMARRRRSALAPGSARSRCNTAWAR
jgi:hypothetical protein